MNELSEPKVEILMATYNGEKYLRKQLDSILNQSYQNWKLLVRDDGSSDNTVAILNEYARRDPRIKFFLNETNEHGWQLNFQNLIMHAAEHCQYYMFCDQDDIWEIFKIKEFLNVICQLEKQNPDKPVLVYANMEIIDSDGKVIESNFNSIYNMNIKHGSDVFYSSRCYGCNMMINSNELSVMQRLLTSNFYKLLGHDGFAAKTTAALNGIIYFIDKPCMQYRRTQTNATASQEFGISAHRVAKMMKKFDTIASNQVSVYYQSLLTIQLFREAGILSQQQLQTLEEIYKSILNGGLKLLFVWIKYGVSCGNVVRSVSHFIVLFTGRWKRFYKNSQSPDLEHLI